MEREEERGVGVDKPPGEEDYLEPVSGLLPVPLANARVGDQDAIIGLDKNDQMPVVAGFKLEPQQLKAFEVWALHDGKMTARVHAAAKAAHVEPRTIWRWRHEKWWEECYETFIKGRQQDLHTALMRNSDDVLEGALNVARGTGDPKMANAAVGLLKAVLETGKEPVINKRAQAIGQMTNVGINNYGGTVNIDRLRQMTAEEMDEMERTGTIPAHLLETQ